MNKQTTHSTRQIDELIAYQNNARVHSDEQVDQIANSIKEFGFINPVLTHGNTIMAGHGRILAAKKLGITEVPTVDASYLTDKQKRAYILADNRLAELATWDDIKLKDELITLDDVDIDLAGFGDFDLTFDEDTDDTDDTQDQVPEQPAETRTKLGDFIELGNHRLLCGDCTIKDNVDKLMGGKKADMVFTDPPYGLGGYGGRNAMQLKNDDANDSMISQFFNLPIYESTMEVYLWGNYANLYKHIKILPRDIIVWYKNNFGLGKGYRGQYEICFYYGNFSGSDSDVWSIDKDIDYLHPTQKPVSLAMRAIKNSQPKIVVDLFLGSGSTLIACEKTGRKCYGMELDESYCDVIIKRWLDYTANDTVKINGESVKW